MSLPDEIIVIVLRNVVLSLWQVYSVVLSVCSGAQRSPLDPIPNGARHSEGLERHGAHLAVCVFKRPASDVLRGGEIPHYRMAQVTFSVCRTTGALEVQERFGTFPLLFFLNVSAVKLGSFTSQEILHKSVQAEFLSSSGLTENLTFNICYSHSF